MAVGPGDAPSTPSRGWTRIVAVAGVALALTAVVTLVVALQGTCGGNPAGGACPTPTPDITSPVDGVVVAVDAAGLGDVRGFTLRVSGGFSYGFVLGDLDDPTAFPPGHLAEHQATSTPIRVWFVADGDRRVVYRLEDAPSPTGS